MAGSLFLFCSCSRLRKGAALVFRRNRMSIYRVVWDDENPDWNYKCRSKSKGWKGPKAPPAVVRFFRTPKTGSDYRVNISEWEYPLLKINNWIKQNVQYLKGAKRALMNQAGWPQLAYILMSGNLIEEIEIIHGGTIVNGKKVKGDWLKFRTVAVTNLELGYTLTRKDDPTLVHNFTCVGWKDGQTKHISSTNTRRGQVYYFCITKEGFGYIPLYLVRKVS